MSKGACPQARGPEFDPKNLHGRQREPALASCPLPVTYTINVGEIHVLSGKTALHIVRSRNEEVQVGSRELANSGLLCLKPSLARPLPFGDFACTLEQFPWLGAI